MRDCGAHKFTLYGCPSCGTLWVAQDAIWDHGTWYRKYVRVASRESFAALVASVRVSMAAEVPTRPESRPLTASDIASMGSGLNTVRLTTYRELCFGRQRHRPKKCWRIVGARARQF
jgi:hypothetical protein